ncbi:VOC family protein [Actinokineospora sp.]|uniref:VOC family protein n=1 Tax=Actinokineospora sp. TaxID=1872133 RepID=UPI003D6BBFFE
MRINRFTVAVTVDDVVAGTEFHVRHFGFRAIVAEDFIAKLLHDDPAYELCLIKTGTFGEGPHAAGVVLALEVEDIEAEVARLEAEGVTITVPIQDEEWGERLCQVTDPNGLTVQLVQWVGERPA